MEPDTEHGPGGIDWLEGGSWAWDEAHGAGGPLADATELDIPGLADGAEAWAGCEDDGICSAHLIADGNWIRVFAYPDRAKDAATSAKDVLAAVAGQLG